MKVEDEPLALQPAMVATVVERIVAACDPRTIIAFGSRARGEAHRDSDLDLVVVLREPVVDRHSVERELRTLLAPLPLSTDILVSDPEHFARESADINSVYNDAALQGVALWEDDRIISEESRPFAVLRTAPVKDRTATLLKRAADDEAVVHLAGLPEVPFGQHVQGALEKLLKALIHEQGQRFERTHDLTKLAAQVEDAGNTLPPVPVPIGLFSPYALDLRYGEDLPSPLDRPASLQTVEIIRAYVTGRIQALNS